MISSITLKSCLVGATPPFLRVYWHKLEASPLGYRLARGAFWSFAGALVSRACGLISSIFVARMLGKVGFGEFGIVQSSVGMFATFAGFGLGLTSTKYVAEFRVKEPARAGRIIGVSSVISWVAGGVMTGILFMIGPWLATHTLEAPHLGPLLRISSLLLVIGSINGAQTGALAGFEAFKRIAHINLTSGVFTLPLMVTGAWWGGLKGAVWGLLASQTFACVLNFFALRCEATLCRVPIVWRISKTELGTLLKFSLPALLVNMLVGPVYWLGNAMLVNSAGGYAEMGLFNAANQWFGALLFLPGILGQAALPVLSERFGQKDLRRSRRVLGFYIKLNGAVVTPLVILGCLASPLIMSSYGPGFRQAWPVLSIVLVTAGLLAIQTPVGQVLVAAGRMWLGVTMNLGWAVFCLLLTWILVRWGAAGLASARLGAYLLHTVWTTAFALYFLRPPVAALTERDACDGI
jgi:O-antigen/teichoic acid export membrane protein